MLRIAGHLLHHADRHILHIFMISGSDWERDSYQEIEIVQERRIDQESDQESEIHQENESNEESESKTFKRNISQHLVVTA